MFFLIPTTLTRPSILERNKDLKYHCDFARYCIGQSNNALHQTWLEKIQLNKRFYKGDQWIFQEDVDTFLKDDDNNDRNRLSIVVKNVIRPMVEQYRGNAIRMNINYRAKSISPQFINRRETSLAQHVHLSKVANREGNPFGPAMKKKFPIGDNEAETIQIHDNLYVDKYVERMNGLCKFVSDRNKFVSKQPYLAMNLAFSGLAVMKNFEYAGHQEFDELPSENFYWDRSSKKDDLSDSMFQGDVIMLTSSEIFEQAPYLDAKDREAIENYSRFFNGLSGNTPQTNQNSNSIPNGKIPCFRTYWKDGEHDEYGYVKDQYGYDYFTRINYIYDGEDKPRYTDKDLIVSKSIRAKRILDGKKKTTNYYDTLRMAIIIPREILASVQQDDSKAKEIKDIVLDWGLDPYQESETIEYNSVKFPYKCTTWAYVDGEVLSPMDDAIDPQRLINRIFSVAENQINNMKGSGMIIDKAVVEDEAEVDRNMNGSKTVWVDARGRGVQNVAQQYDGSRSMGGATGMFQIIEAVSNSLKETTGVNDAIQGNQVGTGNDQLVGVTQLMIERGSLMQESFYNGLANLYEQCYDAICSRGKRIYADNERNLAIAVGDEGVEIIRITKDMKGEDFRTFVKRENSDEMLVSAANQQLLQFKQLGMLNDERIANLWNRSSPDEVAKALREYAREKQEIQRMSQKDQQQQMAAVAQDQQQQKAEQKDMYHEQVARQDIKDITDQRNEQKKEATKNLGKLAGKNPLADNLILKTAENLQQQHI